MFIYEPPTNLTDSALKGEGNICTEKYQIPKCKERSRRKMSSFQRLFSLITKQNWTYKKCLKKENAIPDKDEERSQVIFFNDY